MTFFAVIHVRSFYHNIRDVYCMGLRWILKNFNRICGRSLLKFVSYLPVSALEIKNGRSIVALKLVGLGDTVLMLPILKHIRQSFPNRRIIVVVTPVTRPFFIDNSDVDEVVVYDILGHDRGVLGLLKFIFKLRRLNPSVFIDFEQHYFLTPLVALLSGACLRLGLFHPELPGRDILFSKPVFYDDQIHMVEAYHGLYQEMCQALKGCALAYADIFSYKIPVSFEAEDKVNSWKFEQGITKPLIGIHPGCGSTALYRRWPVDRVCQLVKRLLEDGRYQVVLTGGPDESHLLDTIASTCSHKDLFLGNVFDFRCFVALLSSMDCFVCNDTGPLHIAPWVGTRTIGLFGPNLPVRYGPQHSGSTALFHRLSCAPCIQVHKGRVPSKCEHVDAGACMKRIHIEEVRAAIEACITSGGNSLDLKKTPTECRRCG